MRSSFFYGSGSGDAAAKIQGVINAEPDFLSDLTASSTRAVGDAVQLLVERRFEHILGNWCAEYSSSFARRAMADLAFKDREGFYCIVDVKTHRQETAFNMPALVSVERLTRFYEDDLNIFSIIMIKYEIIKNRVQVNEVLFCPIEFLDWDCLTVGALGWGQIQIANSRAIKLSNGYSRKKWMLQLCERMLDFYPKEILKIDLRIKHFNNIKATWELREDIWG